MLGFENQQAFSPNRSRVLQQSDRPAGGQSIAASEPCHGLNPFASEHVPWTDKAAVNGSATANGAVDSQMERGNEQGSGLQAGSGPPQLHIDSEAANQHMMRTVPGGPSAGYQSPRAWPGRPPSHHPYRGVAQRHPYYAQYRHHPAVPPYSSVMNPYSGGPAPPLMGRRQHPGYAGHMAYGMPLPHGAPPPGYGMSVDEDAPARGFQSPFLAAEAQEAALGPGGGPSGGAEEDFPNEPHRQLHSEGGAIAGGGGGGGGGGHAGGSGAAPGPRTSDGGATSAVSAGGGPGGSLRSAQYSVPPPVPHPMYNAPPYGAPYRSRHMMYGYPPPPPHYYHPEDMAGAPYGRRLGTTHSVPLPPGYSRPSQGYPPQGAAPDGGLASAGGSSAPSFTDPRVPSLGGDVAVPMPPADPSNPSNPAGGGGGQLYAPDPFRAAAAGKDGYPQGGPKQPMPHTHAHAHSQQQQQQAPQQQQAQQQQSYMTPGHQPQQQQQAQQQQLQQLQTHHSQPHPHHAAMFAAQPSPLGPQGMAAGPPGGALDMPGSHDGLGPLPGYHPQATPQTSRPHSHGHHPLQHGHSVGLGHAHSVHHPLQHPQSHPHPLAHQHLQGGPTGHHGHGSLHPHPLLHHPGAGLHHETGGADATLRRAYSADAQQLRLLAAAHADGGAGGPGLELPGAGGMPGVDPDLALPLPELLSQLGSPSAPDDEEQLHAELHGLIGDLADGYLAHPHPPPGLHHGLGGGMLQHGHLGPGGQQLGGGPLAGAGGQMGPLGALGGGLPGGDMGDEGLGPMGVGMGMGMDMFSPQHPHLGMGMEMAAADVGGDGGGVGGRGPSVTGQQQLGELQQQQQQQLPQARQGTNPAGGRRGGAARGGGGGGATSAAAAGAMDVAQPEGTLTPAAAGKGRPGAARGSSPPPSKPSWRPVQTSVRQLPSHPPLTTQPRQRRTSQDEGAGRGRGSGGRGAAVAAAAGNAGSSEEAKDDEAAAAAVAEVGGGAAVDPGGGDPPYGSEDRDAAAAEEDDDEDPGGGDGAEEDSWVPGGSSPRGAGASGDGRRRRATGTGTGSDGEAGGARRPQRRKVAARRIKARKGGGGRRESGGSGAGGAGAGGGAGSAASGDELEIGARPTVEQLLSQSVDTVADLEVLGDLEPQTVSALLEKVQRKGKGGRAPAEDPRLDPSIDPRKARRILANRISAARSKLKQKLILEGLKARYQQLLSSKTEFSKELSELRRACKELETRNRGLAGKLKGFSKGVPKQLAGS